MCEAAAPRAGTLHSQSFTLQAAPRLRPCTGQASELSVSSCWASSPQPTYALDRPWTTPWLQPSLSTATGKLSRFLKTVSELSVTFNKTCCTLVFLCHTVLYVRRQDTCWY